MFFVICIFNALIWVFLVFKLWEHWHKISWTVWFCSLQSSDLGSRVVTLACSFLTAAGGKRSAMPASVSTDTFAAPRSGSPGRLRFTKTNIYNDAWQVQINHWPRVLPGEVRSSALSPPQSSASSRGHKPCVLPRRSRVCGASVPHLLLAALPPVGCLFNAGPPDTPAHPVWAQQRLPRQPLCSHHAHLQERQSATGEGLPVVSYRCHLNVFGLFGLNKKFEEFFFTQNNQWKDWRSLNLDHLPVLQPLLPLCLQVKSLQFETFCLNFSVSWSEAAWFNTAAFHLVLKSSSSSGHKKEMQEKKKETIKRNDGFHTLL